MSSRSESQCLFSFLMLLMEDGETSAFVELRLLFMTNNIGTTMFELVEKSRFCVRVE
jgi:hypothetical protein